MKISELYVEYQLEPLGLDESEPRFSWLLDSDQKGTSQTYCRLRVGLLEGAMDCWDSGLLQTDISTGIVYQGQKLKPCMRYFVSLEVTDNHGETASESTWFETGLMDDTINGWQGAQWLCAPEFNVEASVRGIFCIETEFAIQKGSTRAGVIFGARDERLLDCNKNEFGLCGENYIRFEIDTTDEMPMLRIYRVGYDRSDNPNVAFANIPLTPFNSPNAAPLITNENKYDFHTLKIEVPGNQSYTYFDGVLVDAVDENGFFGMTRHGRQLNPRGINDVITYPRLCEAGFYAGDSDTAVFKYFAVRNIRHPASIIIDERPGNSRFDTLTEVENDCFVIRGKSVITDLSHHSLPMFRSEFAVNLKDVSQARLYITSRGIYDCKVNGKAVTDRVLLPGITQYDKRLNYQTYDITNMLQDKENAVGVVLSSGWWSDAQTFALPNYNYFGDKEAFLAQIVIRYQNGSSEVLTSNTKNWKYFGEGPFQYGGLFYGEYLDGRNLSIYQNFSIPLLDDSDWKNPSIYEPVPIASWRSMPLGFGRDWPGVNRTEPRIVGEYDAPVYIVEERCARSRRQIGDNIFIYDLEQEMAGVPRIRLHEKSGTRVMIRYAEMLYPSDHTGNDMEGTMDVTGAFDKAGKLMLENYRDATSTDIYICNGCEEGEVYQPKFTFHGYRYIEISGLENPPDPADVVSCQYSSVTNMQGGFDSSHKLLNRFVQNVFWSQKCNFINIPTDCPQRNERMGWAGDTHVFCHTALQNSNLKLFYERNLQAMSDLQEENGQFPEIAPIGGGFGGITYECASIFMTWELYQQYGDVKTIQKFFPALVKYMDYMKNKGLPGEGDRQALGPLGDWLAPVQTDEMLMWNAFYYKEAETMRKLSVILDKKEKVKEYQALTEEIKEYWNRTFIDPDDARAKGIHGESSDTQTAYALGLETGVINDRNLAAKNLRRLVRESSFHVQTGFFGTGILNQELTNFGYVKEAYALMLQTSCPSWLYPVTQGATSIWERWDSYTSEHGFGGQNSMNSFNHYSLGSVLSWIYSCILGIVRDEDSVGWKHFILRPQIMHLDYANGSVATQYGAIKSGWSQGAGVMEYRCSIPVNTTATLCLPCMDTIELGSGTYQFTIPK
ncbi:MAG: family 78 glycoside hydrolase catalytic domain [Lachnospiraceae bacterium]